jgi:hypothetical protein
VWNGLDESWKVLRTRARLSATLGGKFWKDEKRRQKVQGRRKIFMIEDYAREVTAFVFGVDSLPFASLPTLPIRLISSSSRPSSQP